MLKFNLNMEVSEMPFYRQDRREQYPYPMARQRYGPQQMFEQQFGPPRNNAFSRRQDYSSYPYPMDPRQGQPQFNPNQQMPGSRQGSLSDNLNTMMGHVGTITNGINAMRQIGSIFSLFR